MPAVTADTTPTSQTVLETLSTTSDGPSPAFDVGGCRSRQRRTPDVTLQDDRTQCSRPTQSRPGRKTSQHGTALLEPECGVVRAITRPVLLARLAKKGNLDVYRGFCVFDLWGPCSATKRKKTLS